jgi:hypothetical protein
MEAKQKATISTSVPQQLTKLQQRASQHNAQIMQRARD